MGLPGLILAAAVLAGAPSSGELISASADLSGTFPSDQRSQCRIGACHTFTTIALLESGLKRKYGREIRLSEADLFVRKTVESGNYRVLIEAGKGGVKQVEAMLEESGDPYRDLEFALKNGVATQASAPWDKFLDAYARFSAETREACSALFSKSVEKVVGGESGAKVEAATCVGGEPTFLAFLDKMMHPTQTDKTAIEGNLLNGDPVTLSTERSMVKDLSKDFALRPHYYETDASLYADPDRCLEAGKAAGKVLFLDLQAGRPLALCLDIGGLKDWSPGRRAKPEHHCFAVVGFSADKKGMSLESRNSWGGRNPGLADRDFCRIHELVTLEP